MVNPVDTKVRTDKIRADMLRLQFLVERATQQLQYADERNLPESQPYFSFKSAQSIEDLKGPGLGLRAALRNDIAHGKRLLKQLRDEAGRIRRGENAAAIKRQHDILIRADAAADQHAMRVFNKAAQARGYLTDDEFAEVQTGLLKGLKAHSEFVTRNPTQANVKELLGRIGKVSALGMDETDTAVAALKAVTDATRKIVEISADRFLKKPTPDSAKKLLQDIANDSLVGGDSASVHIEKLLPKLTEAALAAERKFRQSPSQANCEAMFNAEYACVDAGGDILPDPPKGLRRIKSGTTRFLSRGDTLSGISKEYYGSFSYWDTIVRANWGIFLNPDVPKVGITIDIPH